MALALVTLVSAAALNLPAKPAPARADDAKTRPDCHVLAVGVDQYHPDSKCGCLKGCEADAKNLTQRLKDQGGRLFGTIDSRLVLSKGATGQAVRAALAQAATKGKAGDWTVLVLSGHGGSKNGRWFFLCTDSVPLTDTELLRWADTQAAQGKKVWIIVDACHAGQLRVNARELLERYQEPQGGGILLMVAAMPSESSMALGQFSTYAQAVNEALAGEADFNGDGVVTLREARTYAYDRALELNRQFGKPPQNGECAASLSISDSQPLAQSRVKMLLRKNEDLTAQDGKDTVRTGSRRKLYKVKLQAGTQYVIDLKSMAFDTYLRIEDPQGYQVAENDDISNGNRNSQVVFTPGAAGAYRIVATSYEGGATGSFTLTVKQLP
jgi:hypothetical protein